MEPDVTTFNPIYVYIVYAISILTMFAYLFYIAKLQSSIKTDIELIKKEVLETKL